MMQLVRVKQPFRYGHRTVYPGETLAVRSTLARTLSERGDVVLTTTSMPGETKGRPGPQSLYHTAVRPKQDPYAPKPAKPGKIHGGNPASLPKAQEIREKKRRIKAETFRDWIVNKRGWTITEAAEHLGMGRQAILKACRRSSKSWITKPAQKAYDEWMAEHGNSTREPAVGNN